MDHDPVQLCNNGVITRGELNRLYFKPEFTTTDTYAYAPIIQMMQEAKGRETEFQWYDKPLYECYVDSSKTTCRILKIEVKQKEKEMHNIEEHRAELKEAEVVANKALKQLFKEEPTVTRYEKATDCWRFYAYANKYRLFVTVQRFKSHKSEGDIYKCVSISVDELQ